MPFCTKCAHAIPDGSRFCPACGEPVAVAPELRTSQDPTRTSTSRPEPPPSASSSSSGIHGRFEPGTRLGTRYRIVALLGRGGMGEVYRADDLELGQSVALKFLPAAVSGNAAELARFRGEVRVARQIAHPNVCRVYDIGEADGNVFLSMEYIDGEDLASVLRRMGRPTADKAIEIARQICLGLAAAHEAGMLHRDLKPANVMIDGRGRARITDFGLAGLADDLARDGQWAGTPAYMAPEQIAGGRVSVRSDLYALGLVLYEVFTGKRAFPAGNMTELRRMHDSGTLTTPSDLARDIDPAVERVILHCLERDPESRPPSAYAVLGALPGGDPLAAALAAGETPSPELVANAGDRGGLSVRLAAACLAAGLVGIGVFGGIIGPGWKAFPKSSQELTVRAADILARTGCFETLPLHTSEGFGRNEIQYRHLRADPRAKGNATFFWRRWSPRLIEPPNIHRQIPTIDDPPQLGVGEAAVLLDPEGRLVGLRAIPPDTVKAARTASPAWSGWLIAAGLDSAAFRRTALARPVPAVCDSAAAWRGPAPGAARESVTVQMGASRGRLAHFTAVYDWGATTAPVDSMGVDPTTSVGWVEFLFGLFPIVASLAFGVRNLQLGRGDWRGATRVALFVFVMNLLEALFTTRLSEVGLIGLGFNLVFGRALGHALIHTIEMWFSYVALEPYVRRLWPRILVSWTRLISGRPRDPLVGRDLLIGAAAGALIAALGTVGTWAGDRLHLAHVPSLLSTDMLLAFSSLTNTGCQIAYAGSICIGQVFTFLVVLLVLRLATRRTWAAIAIVALVVIFVFAPIDAKVNGWFIAETNAVAAILGVLVLMRFGLLAGATASLVGVLLATTVASLDLSSWYGDRVLVPTAIVVALLLYGAAAALAGKPILGDPLRDARGK